MQVFESPAGGGALVGELARPGICRQVLSTARWLREIMTDAHVHLPESGSRERVDRATTRSQMLRQKAVYKY